MLEYQLVRSKRRKTLGLQVKHGRITVRAPYYVTTSFIDSFIQERSMWLRSKVTQQQKQVPSCDFSQGSSLFFLGEKAVINITLAKKADVFTSTIDSQGWHEGINTRLNVVISERINARLITPEASSQQVKKQLEGYFKQQAEQLVNERLNHISSQINLAPNKITIRQYRARWGSCNNRKEVSFNYLLMMTPLFVIDYVIVHELCHLIHLNHSKDFWQLVAHHMPNYQDAIDWLKQHQGQLDWQQPK